MSELKFPSMPFLVGFDLQTAIPLDPREYFTSFKDAEIAAKEADVAGSSSSKYYIGLTIKVVEGGKAKVYTILPDHTLLEIGTGTSLGVPILTRKMADDLGENKPDKYVQIPDDTDFEGEPKTNTFTTLENGNYLDILFSTIRALQTEVARLKNAFKYGINSYNNSQTAISDIYGSYSVPEEEPLWAVDEDDLSILTDCTFEMNKDHLLEGVVEVDLINNVLKILDGSFTDPDKGFKTQKDPKSFLYLTTRNKNIKITLADSKKSILIDLGRLNIIDLDSSKDKYNILVIVSKLVLKENNLYGLNYIWISVSSFNTNEIIKSGYYNTSDLQEEPYLLNESYYIEKVLFWNNVLYKFNAYTKYLDFTEEVIPTYPSDETYKLQASHITIRSVKNVEILKKISDLLLNNELIWEEDTKKLNIKSKGKLYTIGSTGGGDNDTMNLSEFKSYLDSLGIEVVEESTNNYKINVHNLASVTFIHLETGKKFIMKVDSEGKIHSTLDNQNTLAKRLEGLTLPELNTRGFISKLRIAEYNKNTGGDLDGKSNVGLLSDRVKIGAIYAPRPGRDVFGCSHAYIELENTADCDFCLKGVSLHMIYKSPQGDKIETLPLTGTLFAGGTYLIRGKQYAPYTDTNVNLKVKTYDLEWYTKEGLMDLLKDTLGLMLMYHPDKNDTPISSTVTYVSKPSGSKALLVANGFIDIAFVRGNDYSWLGDKAFTISDEKTLRDYILKNTFELDPAKLAFLAINDKDSSRIRGSKVNDFKPFYIDDPKISFIHSEEKYDVSLYTPKASFEHKNVSTDKSKLDPNKPNMVYCSFGMNMHTTRCFNWISCGYFDEYLWVREKDSKAKWHLFESYKKMDIQETIPESSETVEVLPIDLLEKDGIQKVRYYSAYNIILTTTGVSNTVYVSNNHIHNTVYARITGRFPGDGSYYTAHKCIIKFDHPVLELTKTYEYIVGRADKKGDPDNEHCSKLMYFTLYPENTEPRIFLITDQLGFYWIEYLTWAGAALAVKDKIEEQFGIEYRGPTYMPIIINTGDMTLNGTRVNEWIDYYKAGECLFNKYEHMSVVGNNDLVNTDITALGTGDDEGKSNGFFHHLSQCFEIEPNDDLIVKTPDPDPTKVWESDYKYIPSTYYFECTLPNKKFRIICVNSEITYINCRDWFKLKTRTEKIIPAEHEGDSPTKEAEATCNIYTGWEVGKDISLKDSKYRVKLTFTPVYNTLYKWLSKENTEYILACHEMPFTVITAKNLQTISDQTSPDVGYNRASRSLDGKSGGKLIGSHLNHINEYDNIAMYWFSRLLEHFKIKLVIGGHKHTYTCSYPVREFYQYKENGVWKNTLRNGPMKMTSDLSKEFDTETLESIINWKYTKKPNGEDPLLETDLNNPGKFKEITNELLDKFNVFIKDGIVYDTSRLPIVKYSGTFKMISSDKNHTVSDYSISNLNTDYLPIVGNSALQGGIIYFMCLATGYKQTSNKELPGPALAFTKLLPLTTPGKTKDSPSLELQLPMFAIVKYQKLGLEEKDTFIVLLLRVTGVLKAAKIPLYNEEGSFSNDDIGVEYINSESGDYKELRFGNWTLKETNVVKI